MFWRVSRRQEGWLMRLFISIQQNFQNLKSLVINDILDWFNKLSIRRSPLLKTSGSLKKWQGTHKCRILYFFRFLSEKWAHFYTRRHLPNVHSKPNVWQILKNHFLTDPKTLTLTLLVLAIVIGVLFFPEWVGSVLLYMEKDNYCNKFPPTQKRRSQK